MDHMPTDVRTETVEALLAEYGAATEISFSGERRSICFVTLPSVEAAVRAIVRLHGRVLDLTSRQPITVGFCRYKSSALLQESGPGSKQAWATHSNGALGTGWSTGVNLRSFESGTSRFGLKGSRSGYGGGAGVGT